MSAEEGKNILKPGDPLPESSGEDAATGGEDVSGLVLDLDIGPYVPDILAPAWQFLQEYPLLLVLLLAGIGYLLGKALQWVLRHLLSRVAKRTRTTLDDRLIEHLISPVVYTTVIIGLVAAVKSFGFGEAAERFMVQILFSFLLLLWGRAWFRAATLIITWMARDASHFNALQPRTRPLFEMGVKLFLVGVFVWLFMALWDIDGTAWLASAGVIGIAVGFAARDTLANLISGVSIIADAPYKIGDYIVLDTGERGVVTEVGMRSTRLLTRDDVEISIPNAVMGNAKITNESGGPASEHRIRVPVGVAYGSDLTRALEVLEQTAHDNELVLEHPSPRARMRAFADSSVNFELLGWIRLPEQRGLAVHQLLLEIDRRFREEGIQIPFPQRDLHIRSDERRGEPDPAQPPAD
jgi:small-conductance mechanosensitive channel